MIPSLVWGNTIIWSYWWRNTKSKAVPVL